MADATNTTASETQTTAAAAGAKDAIAPLIEKAKGFAKERPWASAALAGVLGIALINTLRGKR